MNATDKKALSHLIEFLVRNPQIIETVYAVDLKHQEEARQFEQSQQVLQDPSNWGMFGPRPPVDDDESDKGKIGYYGDGDRPNKHGETTRTVPTSQVKQMRYFYLLDEMSDLGFHFLELDSGEFLVGQLTDNFYE